MSKIVSEKYICWMLVVAGIVLRTVQYLSNRNLDIDECNYALMLGWLSFKDLFPGDKFLHTAPYGFIASQKLAVTLLGNNEFGLRFVPFVCGCLAVLVFNRVKNYFIKGAGKLVALALFAVSPFVIYFSSEGRAYSSNILIILLLLWMAMKVRDSALCPKDIIVYGLCGVAAIWACFPAIIFLGASSLALFCEYMRLRKYGRAGRFFAVTLIWFSGFLAFYFLLLKYHVGNTAHLQVWGNDLIHSAMPMGELLKWLAVHFYEMFINPFGYPVPALAMLFFFIGLYALSLVSPFKVYLLALPVLLTLILAGLGKYPFSGRVLLFLAPLSSLLIGAGWEYSYVREKAAFKYGFCSFALLVFLLFYPIKSAIAHISTPMKSPEIRETMVYIKGHLEEGDGIYAYYMANTPSLYYRKSIGIPKSVFVKGTYVRPDSPDGWMRQIAPLKKYRRAWVILANVNGKDDERILYYMNHMARRLDVFRAEGCDGYLYEWF